MIYIPIDRLASMTISKQICEYLKNAILEGNIEADEKLPSSRELSSELKVSRNTVIESYEQLIAEGYAYTKRGTGTFTSKGSTFQRFPTEVKQLKSKEVTITSQQKTTISFRTGVPDLAHIPVKKWAQIYHTIALDIDPMQLDYQDSLGCKKLREQIAQYLNRTRGTAVNSDCILITSGAAQSFELLCQLVSQDEYVMVENPMSAGVRHTLESHHVKIIPVELDEDGMRTALIDDLQKTVVHNNGIWTSEKETDRLQDQKQMQRVLAPKLIFTTPSHQFPTGVVLPVFRRIELVELARKLDTYVVEDDYDSEFRFDGAPLQAMQYLDPERVIYVGTFSKTLMPAIRIGYMVLPHALLHQMKEAKYISDIHSPVLEQLTLAEFISSASYELHIRKMKKIYRRKRDILVQSLRESFGENVTITGAHTGLHLLATFRNISIDETCLDSIHKVGIEITGLGKSGSKVFADQNLEFKPTETRKYDNSLLFGYGNTEPEDIKKGIQLLKVILDKKKFNK